MEGDANDRSWELLQVVASRVRARPVLRKTPGYAGGYLFFQSGGKCGPFRFVKKEIASQQAAGGNGLERSCGT